MFLFKSMHIDQEMLHHHHHIIIVIITIIIVTQHTIDFRAMQSLRPSVIMAAAAFYVTNQNLLFFTHTGYRNRFSQLRYLATNNTRPADQGVRGQCFQIHRRSLAIAYFFSSYCPRIPVKFMAMFTLVILKYHFPVFSHSSEEGNNSF